MASQDASFFWRTPRPRALDLGEMSYNSTLHLQKQLSLPLEVAMRIPFLQ